MDGNILVFVTVIIDMVNSYKDCSMISKMIGDSLIIERIRIDI